MGHLLSVLSFTCNVKFFYTSQICSESFILLKIGKNRVKLLGYLEGY